MRTCVGAGARCSLATRVRPSCLRASRVSLQVRAAATPVPSQYKTVSPVGDRVLVKLSTTTPTNAAGIIMPSAIEKKSTRGEVVSPSSGGTVNAGAKVIYGQYAGTDITISGEEYILLKEEDVIGLLDPEASISKMSPLSDRILVQVAEADDTSDGGVLLTSATAEKPTLGKVIAVGPGRKEGEGEDTVPVDINVGSTILYSKYSGTEFEDESQQFVVIRSSEVLAELS